MKGIVFLLGAVLLLAACRVSVGGEAPIDQARLDETKSQVRQLLSAQGTVLQVDMNRQDDDHMTGYADMRDVNGRLGRFTCTASRNTATRSFDIRCIPPAGSVAPGQTAPSAQEQSTRAEPGAVPEQATAPSAANAQTPIESYNARISERDEYNSSGQRLHSVAAIIRQDRARYHSGQGDREDEGDRFFANPANRARLEAMIARSRLSPGVANAILNLRPFMHVDVYPDRIEVTVD